MWKRVSGNAGKGVSKLKKTTLFRFLGGILMHTRLATGPMEGAIRARGILTLVAVIALLAFAVPMAHAQAPATAPASQAATHDQAAASPASAPEHEAGGEASLKLPDMSSVSFLGGISGYKLLSFGLIFCGLGWLFGLVIFMQLKNLPVHRSMREISELIYETCKTYLITQGKFILILEVFIGLLIVLYFGLLQGNSAGRVAIILAFSLVGIAGSYRVATLRIRAN